MIVFDFYSGTGSATAAFKDVYRFDHGSIFDVTERVDIRTLTPEYLLDTYGQPDFIWASPPCTTFSITTLGKHWNVYAKCRRLKCKGIVTPCKKGQNVHMANWKCTDSKCERGTPPPPEDKVYTPKSERAIQSIHLVEHTVDLIQGLNPNYWIIENPVGMMAHLDIMKPLPKYLVTYCQYGDKRQKPTNLFGYLPDSFEPKNCKRGQSCHNTMEFGTHMLSSIKAAMVPYELSRAIRDSVVGAPPPGRATLALNA